MKHSYELWIWRKLTSLLIVLQYGLWFGFLSFFLPLPCCTACHILYPPSAVQVQVNTIKIVFKWLMRTGGIQGSQGPSVERRTEMATGGGAGKQSAAGLWIKTQRNLFRNQNQSGSVQQDTCTHTHTLSHNPTVDLFLSWWHCTPSPSAEWLSLHS